MPFLINLYSTLSGAITTEIISALFFSPCLSVLYSRKKEDSEILFFSFASVSIDMIIDDWIEMIEILEVPRKSLYCFISFFNITSRNVYLISWPTQNFVCLYLIGPFKEHN